MQFSPAQKNAEAFDRWQLLDDDNLHLDEVKIRFFDMPQKLLLATHELDDYYKLFFLSQSILMVIGGLKPATSLSLDCSLLREYEEHRLLDTFSLKPLATTLFDYFSVSVAEKLYMTDNRIEFYVFNPTILEALHLRYPQLCPYTGGNINRWIQSCIDAGVHRDMVLGLLFGFPISSVKQFIQYNTDSSCRIDERHRISSYGESYYVWGKELKRDVRIREHIKETFFTHLALNELYLQLARELHVTAEPFRMVSKDSFAHTVYSLKIAKDIYGHDR